MNPLVRPETPSDIPAIFAVTKAAFDTAPHTSHTEPHIVNALRKAGALTVSLVAEIDGVVVGHAAISPVTISDGTPGWFGLGPVSVVPEYQRRGVGSALIRATLGELYERGGAGCVVLGEPGYYRRFGFAPDARLVLPEVPPEYFQARAFGSPRPQGIVTYHEAFRITSAARTD